MNGDSYTERDSGRHGSSRYSASRDDRRDRGDRTERGDRGDRDRDRRRRSRSPRSRRNYEVDTYSSSRDYRERERESRYAGRDRRDDRAWDRDSRPRRDPRRDDDDRRGGRYNRDPYEDRGGRSRRDRDGFAGGREVRRTASPEVKREPTPDLANVTSVLNRKRRLTQWDIKPAGYENITAEQAKLSGMFPLPGAPRQAPMDPTKLAAFMNNPAGAASASALKPSNSKQAKRILVHNLPAGVTSEQLHDFFNLQMNGANVISGADPCLTVQISTDKSYALVEFRSPEDATYCLALDGITMEDSMDTGADQAGLSIRRPKDYIVPTPTDEEGYVEGGLLSEVKDGPNKISVTNIPIYIEAEQLQELLVAFGQLKAFKLVEDTSTGQSRCIAFCEYLSEESTEIAVEGLNGMELGDGHLKVQKACQGIRQVAGLDQGVSAMTLLAATSTDDSAANKGRVLQLLNMVTPEELMDNETYQEILEDIDNECSKFGKVLEIKVPRPAGARQTPGVGKIFVKYEAPESAAKALRALAGRKFSDRTVVVTHFSEELFDVGAF